MVGFSQNLGLSGRMPDILIIFHYEVTEKSYIFFPVIYLPG